MKINYTNLGTIWSDTLNEKSKYAKKLRELPLGTRFMLCRTREMYRVLRREIVKGKTQWVVLRDGRQQESTLHHSCHVKPVVH